MYDSELLGSLGGPLRHEFLDFMRGKTETDKVIILHIFRLLEIDLPSLHIIIGVLIRH